MFIARRSQSTVEVSTMSLNTEISRRLARFHKYSALFCTLMHPQRGSCGCLVMGLALLSLFEAEILGTHTTGDIPATPHATRQKVI